MVIRERYETIIQKAMHEKKVKIFTGMYRCGKSSLLKAVQRNLRKNGIAYSNMLYIDFEGARHSEIRDAGALLFVVRNLSRGHNRIFLMLDEISNLPDWDLAIGSILERYNCDIYLTGTRASVFDSDGKKEKLLDGNYVEIPVYPYSFREYMRAASEWKTAAPEVYLQDFMIYGNMPGIHKMEHTQDTVFAYLLDVCQAGLLQNVVRRYKLRNVDQIRMVLACVAENLGRPLSAKVISQLLKDGGQLIGKDTVYTILRALCGAQILYKVARYDEKAGRELEAQEKYYFTDWGMYHSLHGLHTGRTKALLENIVCMELLTRGWEVYRLQYADCGIDFMAVREGKKRYIQVSERTGEKQWESWLKAFKKVGREQERDVVLFEKEETGVQKGIRVMMLLDFLNENDSDMTEIFM